MDHSRDFWKRLWYVVFTIVTASTLFWHSVANGLNRPKPPHQDDATSSNIGINSTGVKLTLSTEFSSYSAQSSIETLIGVNLQAPPAPSTNDRAPVDCVVVSDVSGSMDGSKMSLLKETLKLLLNEFSDKDRVGLVMFDSAVHEHFNLQLLSSSARQIATNVISMISAGSATNLSGGLFAGIKQLLHGDIGDGRVRTVLMMTDGEANVGLTEKSSIQPILLNMLKDTQISLHTFGYGSNHNSELLQSMSEAGDGSYYFAQGVDDIKNAFGDALGGMLTVVAQNLELELEGINGAIITKVHHEKAILVKDNKYRVAFNDLYGEEQRDILVSILMGPDHSTTQTQVLKATLNYIDVISSNHDSRSEQTVGLHRTDNAEELGHGRMVNAKLAAQSTRIKVANALKTARGFAEKGDLSGGRAVINDMISEVESSSNELSDECDESITTLFTAFEKDLQESADGLVDQEAYHTTGHKMSNLAATHLQQRSMESGLVSSGAVNAYSTSSKSMMASKFSGIDFD